MRRGWKLVTWVVSIAGCTPRPAADLDQQLVALADGNALFELATGDLVAIDGFDGNILWRFVPPQRERALAEPAPFDPEPTFGVKCTPLVNAAGEVILRYEDSVVVLTRAGRLKWTYDVPGRWADDPRVCPAVTPDSGVAVFDMLGQALLKLDHGGQPVFRFELAGSPAAPPEAMLQTGDLLVRTQRRLLNVSPQGQLNWQIHLEQYDFEEEPLMSAPPVPPVSPVPDPDPDPDPSPDPAPESPPAPSPVPSPAPVQ